jgi:hypothetical protein
MSEASPFTGTETGERGSPDALDNDVDMDVQEDSTHIEPAAIKGTVKTSPIRGGTVLVIL